MGTVLEFRRSEEAAQRAARPVEGTLGEIIIFPGVRIERFRQASSDLPEHAGTSARKRAQRGRKK
jgi:hypothetical protein